jgi:hypothetical protein
MAVAKHFDNLNTSYVNFGALLRYLREQGFSGSIHVALDQYEADVMLQGENATVFEIDPATGRATRADGALERLMVHAREPGGTITIYEGEAASPIKVEQANEFAASPFAEDDEVTATTPPAAEVDWNDLLKASGELIAAVERAVQSVGSDFATGLRAARIELGDDYPFLDPTAGGFNYSNGAVTLGERPAARVYTTGLSECLRRVVNKLAIGKQGTRFRERCAAELAVAARRQSNGMSEFTPQLDRIAGTRVL